MTAPWSPNKCTEDDIRHQRGRYQRSRMEMMGCFGRLTPPQPQPLAIPLATKALHPGPSKCAVVPLSLQRFLPSALANVPVLPKLREAPQRPFPKPMPARRCPHRPGLRTLLSARPTFHSEDIQIGRRSANLSFFGPKRSAAAHPRDRDAWRVRPRPRPAAGLLTRSGFGDTRRRAQKTGTESVQIGPSRVEIYNEIAIFVYMTRRRPVADTARGVGYYFSTSALPLQAPAIP
jgi:hypothetical protein